MTKKLDPCVDMFEITGAGDIYAAVISQLQAHVGREFAVEDPKKTCVHIVAGKDGTAYAGLHPRKRAVLLNIRLASPLKSKRVRKTEQVSANRFHCEILLEKVSDVDRTLIDWLEQALSLCLAGKRGAPAVGKT
ncbi:MAG: hypothetical protein KF841_03180 [Phycisphaerae bacterium]|nr:hypothetical protein [Phycisphaerae bacterium]